MSGRAKKQLVREVPEMAHAVRASRGDGTADMACDDAAEETGITMGGDMLVSRFIVGRAYWMETQIWVYLGRVVAVGRDYVELAEACRMHSDGRHNVMMRTGTAPGIEIETTGGPQRRMLIPVDWIGPSCEWPHAIPSVSI